jgi:ComF family protein
MVSLSLAGIGRAALDLLYPPACVLCGRGGDFLCARCRDALPRAAGRRCDVCWLPLDEYDSCRSCADHPLALTRLRTAFRYEGDVRRLVRAFKFDGYSCLGPDLARPLLDLLSSNRLQADVVVPVALTPGRRRWRGYNQALLLARELARPAGLPVNEALQRVRFPGPQVGSATAEERRRNVQGAFSVRRPAEVAGLRVLLVDDIATTGATLDACARALLTADAAEVSAVCLARED